jgi:hypothetical protein
MTTRAEQAAAVRYVAANYGDLHAVFVDLPVALSKEALLDAAATLEASARERPGTKPSLTPDFLRRLIAVDRELDAAASRDWRFTHETIVRDKDRKIVANMWNARVPRTPADLHRMGRPGESLGYEGWETDPIHERADARFIVHARTALLRRDEAIEHLLGEVERLELELAAANCAFNTLKLLVEMERDQ